MGLDTVELVMEIEEAFDIAIPDDRASAMVTVGDVYEFILEKTADPTLPSSTCLSAAAFYDLRRQIRLLGLPDAEFRPRSTLERAIPLMGRRSNWRRLSIGIGLEFPRLGRPTWISLLNCMLVALLSYTSFFYFAQLHVAAGLLLAAVLGGLSSVILIVVTKPLAIYPPATCTTIRGLVTSIVALNYNTLLARHSTQNRTDVWNTIQMIVAEQLGVERCLVVPQARFVQDLGAE